MGANFPGATNAIPWADPIIETRKKHKFLDFEVFSRDHFMSPYQKAFATNELRKKFGQKLKIDPLLVSVEIIWAKRLTNIKTHKSWISVTEAEVKVKKKDLNSKQMKIFSKLMQETRF